jgi:hypothetical protein
MGVMKESVGRDSHLFDRESSTRPGQSTGAKGAASFGSLAARLKSCPSTPGNNDPGRHRGDLISSGQSTGAEARFLSELNGTTKVVPFHARQRRPRSLSRRPYPPDSRRAQKRGFFRGFIGTTKVVPFHARQQRPRSLSRRPYPPGQSTGAKARLLSGLYRHD